MNNIKFRVGSYLISDLNFIRCNETNLHLRTLNSLLVFANLANGKGIWSDL